MIGRMFLTLLAAAVFATALGVVYTQHQARKSFVELQAQHKMRDDLNIEWGRLQLEQSTWATHGRIEVIARDKLDMMIPSPAAVVLVKP